MSKKVLLVEDHLAMREALVHWLEVLYPEWKFIQAATAEEALEHCSADWIDLVLMDYDMKGVNGLQATQFIKGHDPHIKVVLLTMHEEQPFEENAFAVGADGFLPKRKIYNQLPVVLETLLINGGKLKDE
ncbi:MAG: response regulator [Anaerolineales bacterium]